MKSVASSSSYVFDIREVKKITRKKEHSLSHAIKVAHKSQFDVYYIYIYIGESR